MTRTKRRSSRTWSSYLDFWLELLRRPRQVASVVASSRYMEQRLVEIAEVPQSRFLVELGSGTGGTTQALLEGMNHSASLLAIELIPTLARRLTTIRDPRLLVEQADAVELRRLLHVRKLPQPDRIISGIPFSSLSPGKAHRLMEQIHDVLAPHGIFVAYQFRDAIVPLAESRFGPAEVFREYRNFPPLGIYRWRKDNRSTKPLPESCTNLISWGRSENSCPQNDRNKQSQF